MESDMPTRRRKSKEMDIRQLFMITLGFAMGLVGLLLIITPANYPIASIPTSFNPIIGIILIAVGLVLLVESGD